ncbi:hypothetical protein [Stenotrophomonas sp. PD6]|uniref:hypothetical protein n=1 Tax=Stenotrophomonas sp. PD6 TaxID=3368612 RepID=UPI003BA37BB8
MKAKNALGILVLAGVIMLNIEAVSHVDHPASQHMVIVLERDGWDEADRLHAYAMSIREILSGAVKSSLLPDQTQVTFVMTLPHPANPSGSAGAQSKDNVLRLLVPRDQIPSFLADTERPVVSALFRHARVEFSGRYGAMQ